MKRYAFISMPMRGRKKAEIIAERTRISTELRAMGYETIPSYCPEFMEEAGENPYVKIPEVYSLGKSLSVMAKADLVYFAKGWEQFRGCQIEREVCLQYGIPRFYEN